MSSVDLKRQLYQLSHLATQYLENYLSINKMKIVNRLYLKRIVTDFKYSKGEIRAITTHKILFHKELDEASIEALIRDISEKQVFKAVLETLMKRGNVDEVIARSWLERFLWIVITKQYQGKLSTSELDTLIDVFLDEVENRVTKCRILAWLHNIYLETSKIELDEGVTLRAPMKEDFEIEFPLYSPINHPQPEILPNAILEIERKLSPRVQEPAVTLGVDPTIVERYITALQLYRPCSVYAYYIRIEPRGVIYIGGHYRPLQLIQASTFKCALTSKETNEIRTFIREVFPHLPLNGMSRPRLDHFLGVAIARYQDSLLRIEPLSNKLAYAVFGLEALYLGKEEFGELRHKLAQRVAKVIHLLGKAQDPMSVYKDVKKAYKIRSSFVHGGFEELKDCELLGRIVEYLRLSILIFMYVKDKEQLLDLIDRSMLSKKATEELKNFLMKSVESILL